MEVINAIELKYVSADIHDLVLGLYFAFIVKDLVDEILGVKMRIEVMIDPNPSSMTW